MASHRSHSAPSLLAATGCGYSFVSQQMTLDPALTWKGFKFGVWAPSGRGAEPERNDLLP